MDFLYASTQKIIQANKEEESYEGRCKKIN